VRTLAILITALLAFGGIAEVIPALGAPAGPTSNLIAGVVLGLATVLGAAAFWGGARWGALLLIAAALLGAVMAQANHMPLTLGPITIDSRPAAVWACFLAVAILVALSWRGLGRNERERT
jgi:hypothetical protein